MSEVPLAADELVASGPEREVLETFLDLYREIVVRKVAGLTDEEARRRLLPSATTLVGLVKHLAQVEREWFQVALGGATDQAGDGRDDGWWVPPDQRLGDVVNEYRQACDGSRRVAARFGLDDVVPHPRLGQVSLRWVFVHLIEETARHAGHADTLRELTDGSTGFDG